MRTLISDIKNIFDDDAITDPRMNVFTGSVYNKLVAANTNGDYTEVIAMINAVYPSFRDNLLSLAIDVPLGTGAKEVRETVESEFKIFVSNHKGMIKDKYFEKQHHLYIQFYPDGMEDYNDMNKTTAPLLINRYATAAHTHVLDFTTDFDLKAASFKTRYDNAVDSHEIAKTDISEDRSGRDNGRIAVNVAVFAAYNFAKFKTNCNYDFMHGVFPLETLYRHTPHTIIHLSGTIPPLATVNIAQAIYDKNDWILLHDTGSCDLLIGLELTADTEVGTANGKKVKKGKNKSFRIINTGDANNHFINITNLSLTEDATWKADIYKKD